MLCPGSTVTDFMHNALERFEDDGGDPDRGDVARSEVIHGDLQRGLPPDEVARIALAGIRDGRFFIFTHPDQVSTLLRERFEALAADGTLAPAALVVLKRLSRGRRRRAGRGRSRGAGSRWCPRRSR